ncbi:XRE family transcriptional regulator [Rhodococcus erythropolis]|uniref:helix-turn-helix domain-containing protein n=1 Tax=Rhodococcus erythropolis TaxID=1833 RepID=UPI0022B5CADF|nr:MULTISPECIES: XRE family transcriptional regulator [Rhodococcus erythropolis group]MCZ4525314.1 XRE family transcriptional regulator [Rhodococcus erythropolis]
MELETERKALGNRIREFRKARKLSIRKLSELAGISPAFISQIENGRANASIPVLRQVSSALGIAFVDLFEQTSVAGKVLRKKDRPQVPSDSGIRSFSLTRPPLREVEVAVSEYEPGESSGGDDYTHGDSHEVLIILRGTFQFRLDGVEHTMHPGDSIEYRTTAAHEIRNIGSSTGEALWVVSPPSVP